jgi:hypothetical protein
MSSILRKTLIWSMILPVGICFATASKLPAGLIIATGQNNGDPTYTSGQSEAGRLSPVRPHRRLMDHGRDQPRPDILWFWKHNSA